MCKNENWDITLEQLINNFSGLPRVSVYDEDFGYYEQDNDECIYSENVIFSLYPKAQDYKLSYFLKPKFALAKIIDCELCKDGVVRVWIKTEEE